MYNCVCKPYTLYIANDFHSRPPWWGNLLGRLSIFALHLGPLLLLCCFYFSVFGSVSAHSVGDRPSSEYLLPPFQMTALPASGWLVTETEIEKFSWTWFLNLELALEMSLFCIALYPVNRRGVGSEESVWDITILYRIKFIYTGQRLSTSAILNFQHGKRSRNLNFKEINLANGISQLIGLD